MSTITTFDQLIGEVAASRAALARCSDTLEQSRLAWDQENAPLIAYKLTLATKVAEDEAALRAATLDAYRETGNKKPHEGVAVRMVTRLYYEPEEAVSWAIQHRHTAFLTLNRGEFEKAARVLKLDFVDIDEEPQATIATKLGVTE